jgi:predicted dehydrogenase
MLFSICVKLRYEKYIRNNRRNIMRDKITFAIIGSGWRAECFIETASLLPDNFEVCGVVSRSEVKREYIKIKWGINTYKNIDELLNYNKCDFVLISVPKESACSLIKELSSKNIPLLAETPPAKDLNDLVEMNSSIGLNAKIQIAEQYHLYPMHSARLSVINSNILGKVAYTHVSVSHGYHGVSLIRKILDIGFENSVISAKLFKFPGIEGPGRNGLPDNENTVINDHIIAVLDFDGKIGLFDFEKNQHRSWIRTNRVLLRGERGEINNDVIKYLKDFRTPIELNLNRINTGENENFEGFFLKGITFGDDWIYKNPFIPARLSDDEIAMATVLKKMYEYVNGGESFYSLAEASQDQYLSLMIDKSIALEKALSTETQCWSG